MTRSVTSINRTLYAFEVTSAALEQSTVSGSSHRLNALSSLYTAKVGISFEEPKLDRVTREINPTQPRRSAHPETSH